VFATAAAVDDACDYCQLRHDQIELSELDDPTVRPVALTCITTDTRTTLELVQYIGVSVATG